MDWADRAAEEIAHGVQCGGTGDMTTYRMLTADETAAIIRRHAKPLDDVREAAERSLVRSTLHQEASALAPDGITDWYCIEKCTGCVLRRAVEAARDAGAAGG